MKTYQDMVRYLKHYCREPSTKESLLDKHMSITNSLIGLRSPKLDGDMTIGSSLKDEKWNALIQELELVEQEMQEIRDVIDSLEGKQRIVLQEYFIFGLTQEEIATKYEDIKGLSLRNIQELYRSGIIKLIEKDM